MSRLGRAGRAAIGALLFTLLAYATPVVSEVSAQTPAQEPPELTQPVNDFARLIDPATARAMETMIRSLQQASGDVVVVATVPTIEPYADLREYAVKMFQNHGRGIGQAGKDNGVLIVLAARERQVRIAVGYDLESFITDGFAGQTSREYMIPAFREGDFGGGLLQGVSRVVARVADGRNVTLQGVRRPAAERPGPGSGSSLVVAIFVLFMVINAIARTRRGGRRGRGGWSGWNSGVGPFGGPFGGGFGGFGGGGGGGFGGGGFGGFGGGRGGGGGGGGSW